MQLCFSCQHEFPSSSLASCSFSEVIANLFEKVNGLVSEINPSSPEETHRKLQLQSVVRELCSAVNQEIDALKESKATLESMRIRDRQDRELTGTYSRAPISASNTATLPGSHNMTATMASMQNKVVFTPRATFNGTVPTHKLRRMNSALELVSASIYSVIEALAIRTRSDVALLWLPPPGVVSTELVAPFVVGRDTSKLRNSAPYRVSETSVPCSVSETGIAINIKPRPNTSSTSSLTLMEMLEASNAAQLLVPIFTRYGDVRRSVFGVVHLIGTPAFPCPFTARNEEMAVQTAATLSVILSSYSEKMCGEWVNRIYDPSLLVSTSAYRGALDMRSHEKGIDDFAPPHTLIYRCTNERNENDDMREAVKALRNAMVKRAAPKRAVTSIRDLYRFAMNMESNWVSAVKANTEMGSRITALEDEALRVEIAREVESRLSAGANFQDERLRTDSLHSTIKRPLSSGSLRVSTSNAGTLPNVIIKKGVPLKIEQINEVEISTLRRLQHMGMDTAPFVTQEDITNV